MNTTTDKTEMSESERSRAVDRADIRDPADSDGDGESDQSDSGLVEVQ